VFPDEAERAARAKRARMIRARRRKRHDPVLESETAYALWAPHYPPFAHNALMRAEQRVVEALIATLDATSALDVGTGTGRYLPVLARRGIPRIVGLDRSWPMLTRVRDAPALVLADALRLPFGPATFDLVLASFVVGDVVDLVAWTAEMTRVIRPGGHLLYSDFHPTWTEAGWERTFVLPDGRRVIVPLRAHTLEQHRHAVEQAELVLVDLRIVSLADEWTEEVAAFRARWGDAPVALVVHARKRGDRSPLGPRRT
jgi:malonyl-CoA O-methyltransferase